MASAAEHVQDANSFHLFHELFHAEWHLPNILGFQITKFMVLELVVAGLMALIFIPIARRARNGALPKGRFWNCFESLLTFIRDEVARPNIGEHDADKYVPYLWTVFIFILFCNLLGVIPFMGSPTASIYVTGALAVCSLILMHAAPIARMGVGHYVKSLWPHIDVPVIGGVLAVAIFTLEFVGTFIKSFVLAVRLFANMFAGHMVLATILTFVVMAGQGGFTLLWPFVTGFSVLGIVALSLLELFVAFLQAYVFAFLTALFLGMNLHPQH